jgi:hypothetical protein
VSVKDTMQEHNTIIEHPITYAEAMSLAWLLDLVAARSHEMGCHDAAGGFEACAATFRQSVTYSLEAIIEMSVSTIRNLAATVSAVGERLIDEANENGTANQAWALIADELFYRDDRGDRLSGYLMNCSGPDRLFDYIRHLVGDFQDRLDTTIDDLYW